MIKQQFKVLHDINCQCRAYRPFYHASNEVGCWRGGGAVLLEGRDSHSELFYVPNRHTDRNFICPEEILCAQVKSETWIIQNMFRI